MDSDDDETPPNAGVQGQGTTGGTGQASTGTQGPSSGGTPGVVVAGGQGVSAGGVSAPPSVASTVQGSEQMPLQGSGEGAGMGSGEGEEQELLHGMVTPPQGIQAPLGTSTATPGPAIGTAVLETAEQGRQGAFAITPSGRTPGFTPIREGPAPDVSLAPRAVHRPRYPLLELTNWPRITEFRSSTCNTLRGMAWRSCMPKQAPSMCG